MPTNTKRDAQVAEDAGLLALPVDAPDEAGPETRNDLAAAQARESERERLKRSGTSLEK